MKSQSGKSSQNFKIPLIPGSLRPKDKGACDFVKNPTGEKAVNLDQGNSPQCVRFSLGAAIYEQTYQIGKKMKWENFSLNQ